MLISAALIPLCLLSSTCFTADMLVISCCLLCAVKRLADNALRSGALRDHDNENISFQLPTAGVGCVPLPSAAAPLRLAASGAYTPPYSVRSVQTARRLLPGQPLPQGVVAFGMAMPSKQPQ